ncbi:hypothetical protein BV917_16640 [Leptospira santarosai serovar Guaricura]|nr:hypothetical protein BV917_16640 [Leptospira santarosai serovar Guaricura]
MSLGKFRTILRSYFKWETKGHAAIVHSFSIQLLKVGVPTNYVSLRSSYGLKELFYDKNTRIAIAILWEFLHLGQTLAFLRRTHVNLLKSKEQNCSRRNPFSRSFIQNFCVRFVYSY